MKYVTTDWRKMTDQDRRKLRYVLRFHQPLDRVAHEFNVEPRTVANWRKRLGFPPVSKVQKLDFETAMRAIAC